MSVEIVIDYNLNGIYTIRNDDTRAFMIQAPYSFIIGQPFVGQHLPGVPDNDV